MKPPVFAYVAPDTLDEVLALLAAHGDDAVILAGGQSLLPLLRIRMTRPQIVVDIGRVAELAAIDASETVRIGAMVTYRRVETEHAFDGLPLVRAALPHVAYPTIRNRGTLGGSLSFADPAAEMPAVMLCLGAEVELSSTRGTRRLDVADFFLGPMTTARDADEVLTRILATTARDGERFAFRETCRRAHDTAVAGIAIRRGIGGAAPTIAAFGISDRPVLSPSAAAIAEAEGGRVRASALADAFRADFDLIGDDEYPADVRARLAGVLAERAIRDVYDV